MVLMAFAVLSFIPLAHSAEESAVSETTTVVVEPAKTEIVTDGQTTVVTTETKAEKEAAPKSAQTTVIVEEKSTFRDAITGEPVEEKVTEEEEDMSLRDKVRSKME
jgi:hypothetical protein